MSNTKRSWSVNARPDQLRYEQNKAEIIRLYRAGLGSKRIIQRIPELRVSALNNHLRKWGEYIPGRDNGGGSNRGTGALALAPACALIMAEYRRERRAAAAPDDAWAAIWRTEIARRSFVYDEKARAKSKAIYQRRKGIIREQQARRYREDVQFRAYRATLHREWVARNVEHVAKSRRQWMKKARVERPEFRAACNLRTRLREFVRTKAGGFSALMGCSPAQLRAHIAAKFAPGMSWGNYGEWHLDHILPCASFNLLDPLQQKLCFHYTNLQPLWAAENLAKSDRIISAVQPYLPLAA